MHSDVHFLFLMCVCAKQHSRSRGERFQSEKERQNGDAQNARKIKNFKNNVAWPTAIDILVALPCC